MKPWEIDEVRRAVKGKWLQRGVRQFNGRICTDSRKAAEGEIFVAIAGKSHDAHDFLATVLERNVSAVIVHKELSAELLAVAQKNEVSVLQVDETIAALNRLAAAYRADMRAKVIAVGGSNGKTTTKRIIHSLLSEKFHGHASPASFNNNIGMPLTLLEVEPAHDFVVLEIGTNAPGEISALGEVCRPDIAVITNVGLEHLEKLGDLEGVAREEASIAPFVADGGMIILPGDGPELLSLLKNTPAQKIIVGHKSPLGSEITPDLAATDIVESLHGTTFSINERGTFHLPLLGEHNAINALMAIAVARRLGLSDEQIAAGLLKVTPATGRLQPVRIGKWDILNDAYNANPSSMEAALKSFSRLPAASGRKQRKVVILGDMLELGSASEVMHRMIGGVVGSLKFDLFIAIGPHMKFAAEVAQNNDVATRTFASSAAAGESLAKLLKPTDRLLLKGSHSMALETLLEVLAKSSARPPAPHAETPA